MRLRIATGAALVALTATACIPAVDGPPAAYPVPAYDQPADDRGGAAAAETPRSDPPPPPEDLPGRRPIERGDVAMPRTARPAWEARPVTPDAQIVAPTRYVVAAGDSLQRVADRTGAGADAIARANALAPPFTIRIGQTLAIPGGRYHLVRPGETGIAIGRAYGVEWSRIVAANSLSEPYVLRAGQRILIPGDPDRQPSRAERAAAFRLDIDDILTGGEPAPAPRQTPARPVANPRRVLPPSAVVAAPARLQGGFVWPVDGPVVRRFGPGRSGERNDGITIAVPLSTPVRATADGVVAYAGDGIAALGGLIIIRHGNGWTSVYGYARKLLVQRGQSVRRGETIALSGDTGFADQPELHFELRKGRTPMDPQTQLPRN
ncbi:M23 family metallopeptidase [Sphingomonas sp. A2-49]|uniref:M23 family metallopeptidase n=1 Tax=Sphingomonas sp. A2-49 TaxID=1391375 RepID=UPI0021D1B595|nr:M23 family metallopeptidase [Sphingomonas sp. A2-49]MCU6452800.1 M23 family metallopeptidase [Sphingomonas sp. A2-49]